MVTDGGPHVARSAGRKKPTEVTSETEQGNLV
jgi:hypothetical protein